MLGKILGRSIARYVRAHEIMAVPDPTFGRLDGEDAATADAMMLDNLIEQDDSEDRVTNQNLIQMLEAQLTEALAIIRHQNVIIQAARDFALTITAINNATGESVFRTVREDDLAGSLLNHRYSDLAALLNGIGRPVPGKLPQGTVH